MAWAGVGIEPSVGRARRVRDIFFLMARTPGTRDCPRQPDRARRQGRIGISKQRRAGDVSSWRDRPRAPIDRHWRRSTPGIEATAARFVVTVGHKQRPDQVVGGEDVSRTKRRAHSAFRLRRGRTVRSRAGTLALSPPRRLAHFDRTPNCDRHMMLSPRRQAGLISSQP